MSDWKSGMRHQVTSGIGYDDERGIVDWRCVDCGQWFARWPPDDEACPGPVDPEQRGYARGFAQGIAYAKARCGCEACNRLQSPSAPRVLGQVPPRPERGYAIDPFPSVRGSVLDPDPQGTTP